jgi:hypothetical protein
MKADAGLLQEELKNMKAENVALSNALRASRGALIQMQREAKENPFTGLCTMATFHAHAIIFNFSMQPTKTLWKQDEPGTLMTVRFVHFLF